jgi:microspherule protein 1
MGWVPDPMVVFHSVKFTRQFSLRDIKERWFALLYDTDVCRAANAGVAVLDEEERRQFRLNVLFSAAEENELRAVRPGPIGEVPTLQSFTELLHKRPAVFAVGRTAAAVRMHWARMQHLHLLNADPSCGRLGRMMQGTPAAAKAAATAAQARAAYGFDDVCRQLTPKMVAQLQSSGASSADAAVRRNVDRELEGVDRKNKRKIRKLEHQIALWRSFDDLGIKLPSPSSSFDETTLAILRGTKLEHHMRSRQIIAGRKVEGSDVDVDLSVEEAAPSRISRAQFLVKLRHDRHFYLTNLGKRPTYVNGQPVLRGARCRLFANSVIEICSVALLFTVNDDLMRALRAEV